MDAGFPHSDIDGSLRPYRSPSRFAVRCVLLQFQVARHSPYALPYLIFSCFPRFLFQEFSVLHSVSSYNFLRYRPSVMSLLLFSFQRSTLADLSISQNQTGNFLLSPEKGGDPSPRSRRDTLLRLNPSHRSYLRRLPLALGHRLRVLLTPMV